MGDAGQNHSTKKIGLGEALLRLTPDPPDVAQPSLPISCVFSNKRELAIQQLDAAIDAGDLPLFAFNEKTGELIQILALRWREHQRGWHREMIISGTVKASVGDAKLWMRYKDEDCRLVLLADDFDAWLEQSAKKSPTAISVSEAPATADHAVTEPVRREHAEPFDKGMPDREQRPNSVNSPDGAAHPGDSPAEASTRVEVGTRRDVRRGPKVKYDWPVFQAEFFGRLFFNDVRPHQEINVEQIADDLMTWGQRHLGEENTPQRTVTQGKINEWIEIWRRKPKTEAEELQERKAKTTRK